MQSPPNDDFDITWKPKSHQNHGEYNAHVRTRDPATEWQRVSCCDVSIVKDSPRSMPLKLAYWWAVSLLLSVNSCFQERGNKVCLTFHNSENDWRGVQMTAIGVVETRMAVACLFYLRHVKNPNWPLAMACRRASLVCQHYRWFKGHFAVQGNLLWKKVQISWYPSMALQTTNVGVSRLGD